MIAFFDSGYGGLTVAADVMRLLPEYDYLYLGDNGRAPYGGRSKETITRFSSEAVEYLFAHGAQLIIFACFVASSLALREIQEKYIRTPESKFRDRKILGVVRPIVEYATQRGKKIGVVGTRGTIQSHAFRTEIEKILSQRDPGFRRDDSGGRNDKRSRDEKKGRDERESRCDKKKRDESVIIELATPLLVPFIEEGWHTRPEARMILRKYLRPLKSEHIDSLILGCTHYPFMQKDFRSIMGRRVQILENGKIVAESLKNYLVRHPEIGNKLTRGGTQRFLTTDSPERFAEFAGKFLSMGEMNVEKVVL